MNALSNANFCELGFITVVNIEKLLHFIQGFSVGIANIKWDFSLLIL